MSRRSADKYIPEMPYEERNRNKGTQVAAINDPDAEAVREYARRQEANEVDSEEENPMEEGPEGADQDGFNLEDLAQAPHPVEAGGLSQPVEPTEDEKAKHSLTHLPFANWCESCIAGAGRDGHHRRKQDSADGALESVVQADYTFFARNAHQARVQDESALVTVLTLVDKASGWPVSLQVPRKGSECSAYVLNIAEQYLNKLGHERTTLQVDQENSIRSVAKAIQKRMGADKVHLQESPVYSHQSQGAVEGEHAKIAGLVRTILVVLQAKYPDSGVDVNHITFPWLVQHASWLTAASNPARKIMQRHIAL